MQEIVKYKRRELFGDTTVIEMKYRGKKAVESFLMFNVAYAGEKKQERMMGSQTQNCLPCSGEKCFIWINIYLLRFPYGSVFCLPISRSRGKLPLYNIQWLEGSSC
jgi:hypothetical protein